MYEASETMEGPPTYSKGDIVWVKLSSYWWPGEVILDEDLPGDLMSDFKRPPLVIVKFFDEDSYEYVRNWSNVNAYNCPKKADFIKKGMAGFRAKLSHMAKFPKDIGTAEERTNGNPNILSQPEFLPVKKVNYDEIFGTPSPKKSAKGKVSLPSTKKTPGRDSNQPHITHRRFLGNDDYRAYICVQYPGKDRKWDSDDEEIKKLNEEPEKVLNCNSCSFKTTRLEVMIFHTKLHIQGIYVTSKRKAKKSKGTEALSDSESDIVAARSPKPKHRKKKEVKPKTTDVFTNLLEEWDETDEDMEESITNKKPPKARKKTVPVEKQLPDKAREENQKINDGQENKSITTTTTTKTVTSAKTEPAKQEPLKNTQDDIKNCFDFDEEEEDDEFLMPTSTGRKIPRVIPEKPKPSISELLEQSQKEDDLMEEQTSDSVDDTEKLESTATENGTDKKDILKTNQSFNRDVDIDENIENTFKELMAETELPTLDELGQNLKPEQNFHDARTVKFPDKGGTSSKGGATSKKRFVTSFEDFEAGFRKLEDENKQSTKKSGGDKEVRPIQMLNSPRIDDSTEETHLKPSEEIIEIKGSNQALEKVPSEVVLHETSTIDAEIPEKHTSKKSRTRHSARVKETALSESAESQSETTPSPSPGRTTTKQPDILHSVGRRKTRRTDKDKPVETMVDQHADVKEPNEDATSEETTLDSRRKSSRRRTTKQFVIEEDSEEIIEITREGDSDVMDSSEEAIHLDENTRKELAAIDLEIENLKRSLDITESTSEEEACKETSNQISESVDVESSQSTESIEIVQEDEVPKKLHRTTRHSSSTANLQKFDEKRKHLTEHAKTSIKSPRRVSQRTHVKNEPLGDSVDLSSKSILEVSCTESEHIEISETICTEPEPATSKGRRGRVRASQMDVESDSVEKDIPKFSELNVDDAKTVETLEKPIDSSELVEPPSREKVDSGSHHKSDCIATEPEPTTKQERRGRPRGHQKDFDSDLTEKEVLKSIELNIDSPELKTTETLEESTVSSNELSYKEVDANTNQSMKVQQEPQPSTEQETRHQPEGINIDKPIAPRTKRGKAQRHTKEALQDHTINSLDDVTATDTKLLETTVSSSDLNTQKSEVDPTESLSAGPELTNVDPFPEVLESPAPKTKKARSQKFAEDELSAGKELTDNVPKIEVPEPKQEVTNMADMDIVAEPIGSVVELQDEHTPKTTRGRHQKSFKDKEPIKSAEEEEHFLESDLKTAELPTLEPDISEVPELTHKTGHSRSRKNTNEKEENKPTSQDNEDKDTISLTEQISAKIANAEIVAVEEQINTNKSTKENETVKPDSTDITSTDPAVGEVLNFSVDGSNTEVVLSKPDVDIPIMRKSKRRKHTEKDQDPSAVEDDITKNETSLPMEVSQEAPLEVIEENVVAVVSIPETAEKVDKAKHIEINVSDSVSDLSDEFNLKIKRGRQKKLPNDYEVTDTGSQEAESKQVTETSVSDSVDKLIEHPTPKSRRGRTRKSAKGDESTSSEKYATQTKSAIENTESPRTFEAPSFSMPEEQFYKTRRGRVRKLTQEEEDFARAIQESLKDMPQEQNQVEATTDQMHPESNNLTETDKSIANKAIDDYVQKSTGSSRKSKKGKSRKSLKSQELAATIQNDILVKDATLDDTRSIDSNELQNYEINTVEIENSSKKTTLDQPSRRGRTRKHDKEDQQSETALSKEGENTEKVSKQIEGSEIFNSEIAQNTLIKPTISDAVELPEQPTPKSKRGRPRKHAIQEDTLVGTSTEKPSKIVNEMRSKELTAALEFTKTVLELVENQSTVGNTEAVVETSTQEDTEQKDILMESQVEEPTLKKRRGRSRRHTQNEEVLADHIGKTIPFEHANVAMSDVLENSSLVIDDDMIGQKTTLDSSISEVVGRSSESSTVEPTLSESKMPGGSPPKPKKGRPRKHIEENTENISKESRSISLELEPKLLMVEPTLKTQSQASDLDAHMKDDSSCVVTEPNQKDLGSMGSIIQTAVDQSFSTSDHIPKSGLSEWVGELLKISSEEEGRTEANKNEEIPREAINSQSPKIQETTKLEVPTDTLSVQENAPLKLNIAQETSQLASNEDGAIESSTYTPDTLEKHVNKRNSLKESLKNKIAPILENSQTSTEVMQEIVPACAKPELAVEHVDQLKTVLDTEITDQTDLTNIQAEKDITSKKNDHLILETLDTKGTAGSMAVVKRNDTPSAKGRRGRPRKSICSETLPIEEDPPVALSVLQSKPKVIDGAAFKEINEADKSQVIHTSDRHKLDQLPILETTKQIDNDVKSSVLIENVKTLPNTGVQKSAFNEIMAIPTTLIENKTTPQLPAAVPDVTNPAILESVPRKGPRTIILNRKRIEIGLQNKAALSASVDAVEASSVFKKEPPKTQKSWFKRPIQDTYAGNNAESSQVAFKEVLKQKFKDIVSSEVEVTKSVQEEGPKDSSFVKNNAEYVPRLDSSDANATHSTAKLLIKEDSIQQNVEQVVGQETPYSFEGHVPQNKLSKLTRNSKQECSLVAPGKTGSSNNTSDQKTGLSEEKNRHVPPKKNRWSRRGSYGKSDNDDNILKEQVVDSVPETVVSEEVVIDEQTVEIKDAMIETKAVVTDFEGVTHQNEEKNLPKNVDLEETNQSEKVPRNLDNSFVDFNDSEIILPPKKSKRASEVKYNFLTESFASNAFSLEKKVDSDILSFPTCDDSIMSTSLRNNIEGLIKDIDNFDSSNVSDNITVKDECEKVAALDVSKADSAKCDVSPDSGEFIIKESADILKCVPPKKKKIEYSKQDVTSSFGNRLLSNDINKIEEKLDLPQPPKKKIQKLFETSQAVEKVGKVSDLPQMSPLAKKKSFLFHPEEFAQKVAEITQQIDVADMSEPAKNIETLYGTNLKIGEAPIISLDSKDVEADASKISIVPKKRQKRKSSSYGDNSQKKERRTSSETFDTSTAQDITSNTENEQLVSQLQDQNQVLDTAKTSAADIFASGTLDDHLTITEEHKNEMEGKIEDDLKFCIQTNLTDITTSTAEESSATTTATLTERKNKMEGKIEDDDLKFSIQTNLANIATSTAEELSTMGTATLSKIKNEVNEKDKKAKQAEVGVKEDNIKQEVKEEHIISHVTSAVVAEDPNESEFVPISINPTVMSEKDLADAQVEITTDKVINEKKPTNLGMFSMDFLESSHATKVRTIKIRKTELMGSPKSNNTSGTEFTSKAMTKEFDNRALITQPKAYALKSELLDILEGNSNSSTNSSGSDQKFKTSFDNYDKQTVVQGMFDFEEAIPSQIVLSNKVDPETVLIDSPKLLERLSMSNDVSKVKPKKVLIQSDVKISDNVPKGLVTKIAKAMGTPKPGQKIIIKTTKAQPLSLSKTTGNKPIILSEQIIRPANAPKPVIQPQGIKRQYEDIEDVETAFIITKIAKKAVEEEVIPEIVPEKPARGRGAKASGKAKILQQTIITPKGEIVQSQTPTTTPSTTSTLIEIDQPENDDMVFDINSMPIVLSDDLLTPESIQNMPVVLSEDVMPQSKPITMKVEEKLMPTLAKKTVPNVVSKQQIVFKTTLSGPTPPLQLKQTTKPRILSSTPASANKVKPTTALLATGTSVDGKPTKYVLVPSTVAPTVPQMKAVKSPVVKKQPSLPPKIPNVQSNEPQSPIVGNKIMIVTNQHGQQTRVVLTPQQQKAFIQSQPGSKTKAIIKGAIPKALLESASAGPSGIIQKAQLPSVPQGVTPTVSSQGGLLMTVGKGAKTIVHPKKTTNRTTSKPQKTILIKNQMGQTVRKIQGTDDADLDRQVAEQLEAIKASARLQQANKSPEIINYTNRHIASSTTAPKTAVRRSFSKKIEPVKVKPTVPEPQNQSPKSQENLIPALAPISPQQIIPQVHSQTSPNLQKQAPVKLELPQSSPGNKNADTRLQQQPAVSTKSDSKPVVASGVGADGKPADRPLTQLVIQDGLGNQTTITEGQILAIPSETVDGQPQSYMLVTLDEMGNITPLNNEALMSLDPSLGLGGDLNNMVLQVDQGQGTVAALKPAEPSIPAANIEQNKIAERLPHPQPVLEPKHVPVEQPKPREVPMAVEQQIVIGEGVLPGADAGGQQLIVTGDPIATQKFLESLSDGSTDLANILANAEGGSVLIQADGQQILIKTNTGGQPLMGISENTEAGGNPIFGTHKPNQDILAAALANTDVFPSSDQPTVHSSPLKGMQSSQLSPSGGSGVLYPMHVSNVLETSLTLSSPIMTPLEVPSIPNKKIDDDVDILNQIPKNVDLPITITDPNISQTVAQQQAIGLMELTLPISETVGSGDINSPNYSYSLPSLDESMGHAQKPFNGSMPLLTEDVTEVESNGSSQVGIIRVAKDLQSTESSFSSSFGSLPLLPETIESSREEVVKTTGCFGELGSLPMLAEDVIEDSGSSRGSSKPPRSSPKNIERDIVDEGLSTLGGEMCSSLSEPPPDMFDLASITAKEEEISSDMSSIPEPEGETLSLHSDNSGEIPIQPPIVANLNDLKRPGDDTLEQDEKRQRFD